MSKGVDDLTVAQKEADTAVTDKLKNLTVGVQRMEISAEEKTRRRKETIARWLSNTPYLDHHIAVHSTRLPGTGAWLLQRSQYQDWRDKEGSEILWIHGDRMYMFSNERMLLLSPLCI